MPAPRWWAEHDHLALDDEGRVWLKGEEADTRLGSIDGAPAVPDELLDELDWLRRAWWSELSRSELHREWRGAYDAGRFH